MKLVEDNKGCKIYLEWQDDSLRNYRIPMEIETLHQSGDLKNSWSHVFKNSAVYLRAIKSLSKNIKGLINNKTIKKDSDHGKFK